MRCGRSRRRKRRRPRPCSDAMAAMPRSCAGPRPSRAAGLQEAARVARYRLLREACRRRGILHLLVAHHADDQDETVAMRAARQSGPDGLAGMSAAGRAAGSAAAAAAAWRFPVAPHRDAARARRAVVRRSFQRSIRASNGQGCARAIGRRRRPPIAAVRPASKGSPRPRSRSWRSRRQGDVAIDRSAFVRLGRDQQARLLSRVVQAVGGGDHPPRRDRLERAAGRLCGAGGREESPAVPQDFTLSACRLLLRQVPQSRRLQWIVRPEHGRRNGRNGAQPLIPAAFFACGASLASHLE